MRVCLTERDERLLKKCLAARWLTTSQIQRLFFAQATADAVRKRLRKLAQAGYLRSVQPHQMAEALHTIGPKGKSALESLGLEVELKRTLPKQIDHHSGINDVRIAVETSGARVIYFFAAWELAQVGWRYAAIPDAVFALEFSRPLRCVAEYDRESETVETLCKKLRTYAEGIEGFPFDDVIVAVETPGRLQSLRRRLQKWTVCKKRFLGALLAEIRAADILSPLFVDLVSESSEKRSLQDALADQAGDR